jgi:hypothetical protein
MDKDWVCIHSSPNLQQVALLKTILLEHDIDAVLMNRKDSFYPVIGEAELYVKREAVIRARKIIDSASL